MINRRFCLSALALLGAAPFFAPVGAAAAEQTNQRPFACNLKAFQPEERKHWRMLIDEVIQSVTLARELSDGYALQIDHGSVSLVQLAAWIDLERKCCPFYDFAVDLHGEDGTVWLSLKGREGVKQFIRQDFTGLRNQLSSAARQAR